MKKLIFATLIIFASCDKSAPTYKRLGTDTVFTSANMALDIVSGEHKTVIAMKIRFDNTRLLKNDSTRVEWFRDSVYQIRITTSTKDSLGQPLKYTKWQQVNPDYVLEDYNKKWPLEIKNNTDGKTTD